VSQPLTAASNEPYCAEVDVKPNRQVDSLIWIWYRLTVEFFIYLRLKYAIFSNFLVNCILKIVGSDVALRKNFSSMRPAGGTALSQVELFKYQATK
jgi:hypothetical protein